MLYIDFCRAPKGVWVGCVQYNNGRVFSHGRTLDHLVTNIKTMVNHTWRLSTASVILSSKQMEKDEFEQKHLLYASSRFKGKYWKEKTEVQKIKLPKETRAKKVVVDGVLYNSISEAEKVLGIKPDTLGQALRHNQQFCLEHVVGYADNLPQFKKPDIPTIKEEKQMPKEEKKGNYTYEEKDGILYVYEKKLVAKYEIEKQ